MDEEMKENMNQNMYLYKQKIYRLLDLIDDEEIFKRIYNFIHKLIF